MSAVIRDTFIALHSSNILTNLYKEVSQNYPRLCSTRLNGSLQFVERYKDYRVPLASIKGGLLKKLADREQTTSDDILQIVTKPDPEEPKVIGPLTSTKELLEALDLAIGSDGEDLEYREPGEPEAISTNGETEDGGEVTMTRVKKGRRSKRDIQAAATGEPVQEEPKFVDLTKLLPPVPKKGNFEVNTVKKSLYFFS